MTFRNFLFADSLSLILPDPSCTLLILCGTQVSVAHRRRLPEQPLPWKVSDDGPSAEVWKETMCLLKCLLCLFAVNTHPQIWLMMSHL